MNNREKFKKLEKIEKKRLEISPLNSEISAY